MSESQVALRIGDETLVLHPERAVLWPERRTVIVADTHFGKSALFRSHGVAVPGGSDAHDRERLRRLIGATQARRLIVLGDFLHAPIESGSEDARELAAWSAALGDVAIVVVAGNHDRGAAHRWHAPVRWHEEDLVEPPFCFTHDAARPSVDRSALFTLSGHIHPVVRLKGLRKRAPRVPIFWQRADGLVLPSFGVFTGGFLVNPGRDDGVFAVGPQRVVRFR